MSGVTFASKTIQYAEVDGLAIFEGDIILGTVADLRAGGDAVAQSIGLTGQQFRWPNATIPYEIAAGMPNQQRVTDAIAHWEANTPIRFVLRTAANLAQFPNFVRFDTGGGCSSQIGMRGAGMQGITLGNGCGTGNAIHEIGHTVGLWHEQSREDRDAFVQIVWANITANMQHNFDQHVADGDDLGAYDYGSIMHYPATAFSNNGQPTIIPLQQLPSGVVMGQRNGLSAGDIAGVLAMYPGGGITIKETAKDPITDPGTVKEVRKDPISDPTFKEVRKDPISDPTIKEIRKDPIRDPTIKEIRKDPVSDPTIKEFAKDPIRDPMPTFREQTGFPGRPPVFQPSGGAGGGMQFASPFVLGAPSRAPGLRNELDWAVDEAKALVDEIGMQMQALEQQHAELAAAYDDAVARLDSLGQGGAV